MAFRRFLSACQARPLLLAVSVSCVKASAADLIVQTQMEGRKIRLGDSTGNISAGGSKTTSPGVDWRRNFVFAAFGALYLGGVQFGIYTRIMPRLFPERAVKAAAVKKSFFKSPRTLSVAKQVGFDQFLHVPLLFFPCFYVLKESVESGRLPWVEGTALRGIKRYSVNAFVDMKDQLSVFLPGAIINFSIMPLWLRTPWVAAVSFVYTMILSARNGTRERQSL